MSHEHAATVLECHQEGCLYNAAAEVARLNEQLEAAEARAEALRALLRHHQTVWQGGPEAIIADHERAKAEARHWEKEDDELCTLCAMASTLINERAEVEKLRAALEKVRDHLAFAFSEQYQGRKGRKVAFRGQLRAGLQTANESLGLPLNSIADGPNVALASAPKDAELEEFQDPYCPATPEPTIYFDTWAKGPGQ